MRRPLTSTCHSPRSLGQPSPKSPDALPDTTCWTFIRSQLTGQTPSLLPTRPMGEIFSRQGGSVRRPSPEGSRSRQAPSVAVPASAHHRRAAAAILFAFLVPIVQHQDRGDERMTACAVCPHAKAPTHRRFRRYWNWPLRVVLCCGFRPWWLLR